MDFARLSRKLEGLEKASRQGSQVIDLHRLMRLPEIWYEAYANIYNNKGAMSTGVDDVTVDGMSYERISTLINAIKGGKYSPKPVKRVYIPKRNGKLRPLGVPSGNDKLVQAVLRILLERIYEPIFVDTSHGFRPNRSCHTALKQIQSSWSGIHWFVEFDIKSFFDNMDHDILVSLLEKKIADKRFIEIIKRFLKAGYLEDWKYHATYSGVPQGGIVSPILSNIYLHELDTYMAELCRGFNKGKHRPRNPEYQKISNRIKLLRKQLETSGRTPEAIQELKELQARQKRMPRGMTHTEDFKRLRYCRYADDFICGIIGTRGDADQVMQTVAAYLQNSLKLTIAPDKTHIRKAKAGIEFLSYGIRIQQGEKRVKTKVKGRHTTQRVTRGIILLSVPRHHVEQFCLKYRYGDWQDNKPLHRKHLTNLSDVEIIETYNAELRGLANYYALAKHVKAALSRLQYLSQYSLFKTLACKHKTKIAKVIDTLKVGREYIHRYPFKADWREIKVFQLKHINISNACRDEIPNTLYLTASTSELIRRIEANQCEYCGRVDRPVEVHHIHKLKALKAKPNLKLWQKIMVARRRKTLILCAGVEDSCHRLLHQGKLPDRRYQPKNA